MSTLENARDILTLVTRLKRDISVTDVVNELNVPKSSASRTLSKMAKHGFLQRNAITMTYSLGHLILDTAFHYQNQHDISVLLNNELDRLANETGYASYVNLLNNAETIVIQMRTGEAGRLQVYSPPGTKAYAYASSMGRAILSRLNDEEIIARIGGQFSNQYGDAPRSQQDLMERIEIIRKQGWAASRGEVVPNVAGISAAVMEKSSQQIYGIGIALPTHNLSERIIEEFAQFVRNSAMRIGKQIGDPYWV